MSLIDHLIKIKNIEYYFLNKNNIISKKNIFLKKK